MASYYPKCNHRKQTIQFNYSLNTSLLFSALQSLHPFQTSSEIVSELEVGKKNPKSLTLTNCLVSSRKHLVNGSKPQGA